MNDCVTSVLKLTKEGVILPHLDGTRRSISRVLQGYVDHGGNQSLFVTGPPGCGKTFTIRHVIKTINMKDCWHAYVDCRIFDNDKAACKEFMRQRNQPSSKPVLEALKDVGMGILVLDHFDSMKIVKRQFFLYTLFDSIHTQSISLCVILITSSHEPLTGLEKRVRSRYSPTCFEFPAPVIDDTLFLKFMAPNKKSKWYSSIEKTRANAKISTLFELSPSLHTVTVFLRKAALRVHGAEEEITSELLESVADEIIDTIDPDRFISSLSHLELTLAFVCCYMTNTKSIPEFSFDQVYEELSKQLVRCRFAKTLTSERVVVAWDKLKSLRLLIAAGRDTNKFSLTIFDDDLYDAVTRLPTDVQLWVKSWM